jgi:tetratricopeptide (TPR) repeat protein
MAKKNKPSIASIPTSVSLKNQPNIPPKNNWLFFYFIIFVTVFVYYGNTLSNGYVLDDFSVIKANNIVNLGIKNIGMIFKTSYRAGYLNLNDGLYRPLSLAMFAVEWTIAPDNPFPGHLINLLVFVLCGIVLFKTLLLMMPQVNKHFLFGIVLLFLTHPIHTEVVGNIKSRDELLCFLFSFAAINEYLKNLEDSKSIRLFWAGIFLLIAFFSKESAILTIPLLLLIIFFFKKEFLFKGIVRIWVLIVPFVIYMIVRNQVLGSFAGLQNVSLLDNPVGANKDLSLKLLGSIQIFGDYIKLFFFPHPLIFDHSYNSFLLDEGINGAQIWGIISVIITIVAAFITYKKQPLISFSILFIFISLSLYSNIIFTIGAAEADRFAFLASLGFCIFLAYLITVFLKINLYNQSAGTFSRFYYVLFGVMVLYSVKTISRNKDWKDNITLYSHDLILNPKSAKIHYLRGFILNETEADKEEDPIKKNEIYKDAINEMRTALNIYPNFNYAFTEIGLSYFKLNNIDSAIYYFRKDIKIDSNNNVAINNLASCYFNKGMYEEAKVMYIKSLSLNERFSDAMVNLGSCYGATGKYQEAISWFIKSLEIDPDNKRTFSLMSMTYKNMGDTINALKYENMSK